MYSFTIGIVFCAFLSSAYGLSCLSCDEFTCSSPPDDCAGGLTRDVCGCCDECAKVEGESCGGPWGITGTCDAGLICYKDPRLEFGDDFNSNGVCLYDIPPSPEPCPNGTVFSGYPPSCPPTCDDRNGRRCGYGPSGPPQCVCAPGYVQISENVTECIREEECPRPECEYPLVWKECASGCMATCDYPYPVCSADCEPNRCECAEGYVYLNYEGTECVLFSDCPVHSTVVPVSTEGYCEYPKVYADCGSSCPRTCNEPGDRVCIELCIVGACVCPEGMVLRSMTDQTCVYEHECMIEPTLPPVSTTPFDGHCEYPKVLSECASACPRSCDEMEDRPCILLCIVNACVCPEGMVQRSRTDNTCVYEHECPATRACGRTCPALSSSPSRCEFTEAWMCEARNWMCGSAEWRREIEAWWFNSGCEVLNHRFEARWNEAHLCIDQGLIVCKDPWRRTCDTDDYGCEMCSCGDGGYANYNNMMALYKQYAMRHQLRMEVYREAREACMELAGDSCGM